MANANSGFRIFYETEEYKEIRPHEETNGMLVDFEQLDSARDQRMGDWYIGHECGPTNEQDGGIRTQCRFDENGNFVNFSIYKSMGQRYHVAAATFVSPTIESLEETVTSFGLPFNRDFIIEDKRTDELWP